MNEMKNISKPFNKLQDVFVTFLPTCVMCTPPGTPSVIKK